ncbi:MAG: DNA translocase FtsK 4TM domain-containing protein, partial [Spirochaetota bacterium]|nr:DNA translocase FtsK 4TM domain-containing protein [Spirochaetota bacterium]
MSFSQNKITLVSLIKKGIIFLLSFAIIFVSLSLLTFHPYDYPVTAAHTDSGLGNWLGQPGAFIAGHLFMLLGRGAYFLIPLLLLMFLSCYSSVLSEKRLRRFTGLFLLILTISYFFVLMKNDPSYQGGGMLAGMVFDLVGKALGFPGQIMVIVVLALLAL